MPESLRKQVLRYAVDTLSALPEAPWPETPDNVVLRHQTNRKWFGIVLRVRGSVLGLGEADMVDLLNVKGDPIMVAALRAQDGYLPAYHMNKQHWLSIRLDGSVPIQNILPLLDHSYALTDGKHRKQRSAP